MNSLKKYIKNLLSFDKLWNQVIQKIDSQKILSAKLLIIENNKLETIKSLADVEFSVFSQVGDDGIIQWLINKLPIPDTSKTFIEFGVENYTESTTRFLLVNNNWKGLVFDGSLENVNYIKNDPISWMYELTSKQLFVTAENINTEIKNAGFEGEVGILHIDIDGNDYWVWKAIDCIKPILVIVEYNSAFGEDRAITIPYDPGFIASEAHFSRIYFGASLLAIKTLSKEKGYSFLGCNSNGNNAYFIRSDFSSVLNNSILNKPNIKANFKQNRDSRLRITNIDDIKALKQINKVVFNTITNKLEPLNL